MTVKKLLEDIEEQINDKTSSYKNYTYVLVLLDLLKERLDFMEEYDLSNKCSNLIKKILGE